MLAPQITGKGLVSRIHKIHSNQWENKNNPIEKKFRNKNSTEQKNYYVNQDMNLINNWGHRNYGGKKLCLPAWWKLKYLTQTLIRMLKALGLLIHY